MQMNLFDDLFAETAGPTVTGRFPATAGVGARSTSGTAPESLAYSAPYENTDHPPPLEAEQALTSRIACARSTFRFPTRHEHTDAGSRTWIAPVAELNAAVRHAAAMMQMHGGIRLILVHGARGSGKSTAAAQLTWNAPEVTVAPLPRWADGDRHRIGAYVRQTCRQAAKVPGRRLLVVVVDYDEWLARHADDVHLLEDALCMIDHEAPLPRPTLFLWLTTDMELHARLANRTTRMCRIARGGGFAVTGPPRELWPRLIAASFRHHNAGRSLVECGLSLRWVTKLVAECETLGSAMAAIRDQVTGGAVDADALTELT